MLTYAPDIIPVRDFDPIIECVENCESIYDSYADALAVNNQFMLFMADNIIHGRDVELPPKKLFVRFTRKQLVDKWTSHDEVEHSTIDGTFAHLIMVCAPEGDWNKTILPASYKKSVKSSSALTSLLKQKTEVYRSLDVKTTVVFTLADVEKTSVGAAVMLPELCPWIASKPAPDSPLMKTLVALKDNKPIVYKMAVGEIVKGFMEWYTPQKFEREIAGLIEESSKRLLTVYKQKMDDGYQQVRHFESEIEMYMRIIYDNSTLYEALKAGAGDNEGVNALKDMFTRYKSLRYIGISNTTIKYSVYAPIVAYNVAAFDIRYDNPRSTMHDTDLPLADFLKGVIREGAFDIYAESRFYLDVCGGCGVLNDVGDEVIYRENKNAMPHPHLVHHHCLGGNSREIDNYMAAGNYAAAVEQTISAASGVNIEESATFDDVYIRKLIRDWDKVKYVSRDGVTFYTPHEAYDIMKKEGII